MNSLRESRSLRIWLICPSKAEGHDSARAKRAGSVFHAAGIDGDDAALAERVSAEVSTLAVEMRLKAASPARQAIDGAAEVAAVIERIEAIALAEPAFQPVPAQQIIQHPAAGETLVAHGRIDEDLIHRHLLRQALVQPHIGEHAARETQAQRCLWRAQKPADGVEDKKVSSSCWMEAATSSRATPAASLKMKSRMARFVAKSL